MSRSRMFVVVGVLATAAFGGCSKTADEGPKAADFVGTWREDPGVVASARFAAQASTSPDRIMLTISDDMKFRVQICDPAGKVNAAAGAAEGSWSLARGRIAFSVAQDGLTAKFQNSKPVESYSLAIDSEGKPVLVVVTADERMVNLVRR